MSKFYKFLVKNAEQFPNKEAVIEENYRWTYKMLLEQVDGAASGFTALQVKPGDRVGLMLYNQKEFLSCYFALRKIGAIVVPINIQMLPQDIGFVIQNSGIKHLVIAESMHEMLRHLPLNFIVVSEKAQTEASFEAFLKAGESLEKISTVETEDSSLAFLLYTSGTTGYPKGVMLSEKNILANTAGFETVLDFKESDRMVLALPLFHSYGLIVALTGLMVGATLTLIPKFHPKQILDALIHEKATILPLVPTLFTVLLDLIERSGKETVFPELRFCVSGGASLPTPLLKRIKTVMKVDVIEGYGMTETSPVISINNPKTGSIPGSVGKPLPNMQLKIINEDQRICLEEETGEILVKGDNVMSGYYNLPDETNKVFTEDGWLRTGDLGYITADGNLYISGGRKKDLIIKAGENISPLSIEEVLYRNEGVRETAVVGMPDEKLGEEIVACISLKEGFSITSQEILRFCREHLKGAYIPDAVEFFDELPKNSTGKIVKKLIKESLVQRTSVCR